MLCQLAVVLYSLGPRNVLCCINQHVVFFPIEKLIIADTLISLVPLLHFFIVS